MASVVEIVNRALGKLGAETITSLADNTTNARAFNASYAIVRDAELRRHRWRFSIKRASLPALSTAPVSGIYKLQFQLPSDCLRILDVSNDWPGSDISNYRTSTTAEYSLEGRAILTNIKAPLPLRYVGQIVDTGLFDSAFTEAFACRLAWENCERITQSESKRRLAMIEYKQAIREAIMANALENPPEFSADSSWVTSRIS